jgi:hypothetical protein
MIHQQGQIAENPRGIRRFKSLGQRGIALEVRLQQGQIPLPRQFPDQPGFPDLARAPQNQGLPPDIRQPRPQILIHRRLHGWAMK